MLRKRRELQQECEVVKGKQLRYYLWRAQLAGECQMQRGKVVLRVRSLFALRRELSNLSVSRKTLVREIRTFSYRNISLSSSNMAYKIIEKGTLNTQDYKVYFGKFPTPPTFTLMYFGLLLFHMICYLVLETGSGLIHPLQHLVA